MIVRAKTKRRLLILLASAFFVIAGLAAVYAVRMQRLRTYYLGLREQGIAQAQAGDYRNAQINLSKYLRREEFARDADALYHFAEASSHVEQPNGGHIVLAASQLKRAVQLRPERQDWRRKLLEHYVRIGFNSEAIATADELLKSDPNDLDALRAKSSAYAALRQPEKALDWAERCLKVDPHDLRMHLALLDLYRDPRNLEKARNDPVNAAVADKQTITASDTILLRAQKLLSDNPTDGRYHLIMSVACLLAPEVSLATREELGKIMRIHAPPRPAEASNGTAAASDTSTGAAAVLFARRAAEAEVHGVEHLRLLILHLQRIGLGAEALEVAKKGESLDPAGLRPFVIARLFETEQYAEVDSRLKETKLDPSVPSDVDLLGLRALSLAALDRRPEAEGIKSALLAQQKSRLAQAWAAILEAVPPRWAFRGGSYLENNEALKIRDAVAAAKADSPHNPYLYCFLGDAELGLGDPEQALEAYQQASRLSPLWARPLLQISRLKLETGNPGEAFEAAQAAEQRAPSSLLPKINYVVTRAASMGDDNDAWVRGQDLHAMVTEIQRVIPGEEQTFPVYVEVLARTGRRADAEKISREAMAREKPLAEQTLLRLAQVSRRVGLGLEEACYAAAEKAHGVSADLALARAVDLLGRGKGEEAIRYLDEGRRDKPAAQQLAWRLAWARYLEHVGDPRAAAEWKALADDPALADDLRVQRMVLSAESAHADRELITRTIDRIRKLTGEDGMAWRVARARLLLQDPAAQERGDEAMRLLEAVVKSSRTDVEARLLLALAHQRSGDLQRATEQLREALNINPRSVHARLALAEIHQSLSDFEQARQNLSLIPVNELNDAMRRRLATLYLQQGELRKAIEVMRPVAPEKLAAGDAAFVAELAWRGGDVQRAEALYQQILGRKNLTAADQMRVLAAYADLLAATGRVSEAEAAIAKTASLEVAKGQREATLGSYYARRADSARGNEPDRAKAIEQHRATAVEQFRAAVAVNPTDERAWISLIIQLVRAGRMDEALAAADEAAGFLAKSDAVAAFRKHAQLLRTAGGEQRYASLIASILEQPSQADTVARALQASVDGAGSLSKRSEAIARIKRESDGSPRFVPLLILLTQEHAMLGQRREAAAAAHRAMQVAPASPEVARFAAIALAAAEDFRSAFSAAQRWRELSAGDALEADLFLAGLHIQLNENAAALARLEPYAPLAADKPERYAQVLDLQSIALIRSGKADQAKQLLQPLTSASPVWRSMWLRRAAMMSQTPDEAAKWLEDLDKAIPPGAVEEQVALAGASCELGFNAGKRNYREQGRQRLDQLVERHPDNALVVKTRGVILEQDGDVAGAERDYRRALELDPREGVAANNMAMILARRGGDALPEALKYARKAVEALPRVATVHHTLSFVQAKMKDYGGAVESLQAAIQLDPGNPGWRVWLADVHDKAGNTELVGQVVREVDAMHPDKSRLRKQLGEELQRRLAELRASLAASAGGTASTPVSR